MGVEPASEHDAAHSEEEIKLIVNASQRGGVIDDTERDIIQNAIDFSEIYPHEVMVPRQNMQCLFLNDSFDKIMSQVKRSKHTRYPLCDKDRDNVVGMIHIRDMLENSDTQHKDILKRITRKILFVPENKSISGNQRKKVPFLQKQKRFLPFFVDKTAAGDVYMCSNSKRKGGCPLGTGCLWKKDQRFTLL